MHFCSVDCLQDLSSAYCFHLADVRSLGHIMKTVIRHFLDEYRMKCWIISPNRKENMHLGLLRMTPRGM